MPNTLNGVLAQIPGLAGYEAGRLNNQNTDMANMGLLQKIHEQTQKQNALDMATKQEQEVRDLVSQSGGDLEKAVQGALKAGRPDVAAKLAPLLEIQRKANQPKDVKAPPKRDRYEGETIIQEELQKDGSWLEIGRGPRFNAKASGGDKQPYFTFGVDENGNILRRDARTGNVERVPFQSISGPEGQKRVAEQKAWGREIGEAGAKGVIELPKIIDNSMMASKLIDQMVGSQDGQVKAHPGFKSYVGFTMRPGASFVNGTPEANFKALLDQTIGGAFLTAFETLKGGGQITVIEGEKATDAITRMKKSQSEEEFIRAARDFQEVIEKGMKRAQNKARLSPQPSAPAAKPNKIIKFNELPD